MRGRAKEPAEGSPRARLEDFITGALPKEAAARGWGEQTRSASGAAKRLTFACVCSPHDPVSR